MLNKRIGRCTHALFVFVFIFIISSPFEVQAQGNEVIEMTCFPPPPPPGSPPGMGPRPPCLLPAGIAPEFISPDPSGLAKVNINPDGTASFDIVLEGLAPDLVITAWTSYFFPGGPVPDPIFGPIAESLPPLAGVSAPLAPTYAGFTEGMGPEPNSFTLNGSNKAKLKVTLDYNPLLAGQGPLRNAMAETNQILAPAGSEAEQPLCCPDGFPTPVPQAVGSSLLRAFDLATGFQQLDEDGIPVLIRSPLPVAFLAIVVHVDKTTHGINPGVPILPIPGLSVTTGDHFLLGIFDLRSLYEGSAGAASEAGNGRIPQMGDEEAILSGVYPNPFNPTTTFLLTLKEQQNVTIEVFDMLGRSVAKVHEGLLDANQQHLFTVDADNLASGRYIIQATGEKFRASHNITLLK